MSPTTARVIPSGTTKQVLANLEAASADSTQQRKKRRPYKKTQERYREVRVPEGEIPPPCTADRSRNDRKSPRPHETKISPSSRVTPQTSWLSPQSTERPINPKAAADITRDLTSVQTESRSESSETSQNFLQPSSASFTKLAQAISNLRKPATSSDKSSLPSTLFGPLESERTAQSNLTVLSGRPLTESALTTTLHSQTQYKSPYGVLHHPAGSSPKSLEFLPRSISRRISHGLKGNKAGTIYRSALEIPDASVKALPQGQNITAKTQVANVQSTPARLQMDFAQTSTQSHLQASLSHGTSRAQVAQHKARSQIVTSTETSMSTPVAVAQLATPVQAKALIQTKKEQAAKKRTFAEIMALASGRRSPSLEEIYLPNKSRRMAEDVIPEMSGQSRSPSLYGLRQIPNTQPAPTPSIVDHNMVTGQHINTQNSNFDLQSSQQYQSPHISGPALFPFIPNSYKDFEHIVQPLQDSDASTEARYNPKTIARDVLIATSKHPTQRGLNAHLEILKVNFTKVSDNSDLSTFRWDIVDPSGEDNMSNIMDMDDVSDNDPVEEQPLKPVFHDSQRHKSTTSSSHQARGSISASDEQLLLPPSALLMETVLIDNSNWDSLRSEYIPYSDDDGQFSSTPAPRSRGRPRRDYTPTIQTKSKRFGRPLRQATSVTTASPAPKRRGRPSKQPVDGAEKAKAEDHIPKKRGRPFGSVNKKNALLSSKTTSEPHFYPFKCGWQGCPAEPQNLETLQRHIEMVHLDNTSCEWLKCENTVFRDVIALRRHVSSIHISPYAFHMGDGPKTTTGTSSSKLLAFDELTCSRRVNT